MLVEGLALGAEEGEFLVGGVEDGGDGELLELRGNPDANSGEFVETKAAATVYGCTGVDLVEVDEQRTFEHPEQVVVVDLSFGFEDCVDRAD